MTTANERWWFLGLQVLISEQSLVHYRYSSILQHTQRMFCNDYVYEKDSDGNHKFSREDADVILFQALQQKEWI